MGERSQISLFQWPEPRWADSDALKRVHQPRLPERYLMRNVLSFALVSVLATTAVLAAPGVTTTSVNFRSGPGTNYSSIRTLPAGTAVEIGDCEESGSWCNVTAGGKKGFVSGRYLQASEPDSKDAKG